MNKPTGPLRGTFRRISSGDRNLRLRRDGLLDSGADISTWFETVGPVALRNGWPVYPEAKSGTRKPAIVQGKALRPIKDYKMDRQLPSTDVVDGWAKYAFEQNTAILTGDAADIVVVDADIFDPVVSAAVEAIADEVLGRTVFKRVANAPKFAMVYRRPRGRLQLAKKIFELDARFDGKKQMLEIKDGQALTVFGHHADSGRPILWVREGSPITHRPDVAPLVTEEMVKRFLQRVDESFPLLKFNLDGVPAGEVEYADTDVADIRVPRINEAIIPAAGLKLTEGRKAEFLLPRAGAWAVANAGVVAPLAGGVRQVSDAGVKAIAKAMADEARLYVALGCQRDDDLTERTLVTVITAMIRSAAEKVAGGVFKPKGTIRARTVAAPVAAPTVKVGVDQYDDEFSWLPPIDKRAEIKGVTLTGADAVEAKARALIANRGEIMQSASRAVRRAIDKWLMQVALWDPEGHTPPPTLLLKAPTGAGKTTALIEGIARFKTAHPDLQLGPILMLLPGYSNIHEVAAREDLGVWTQETEHRAAKIVKEAGGHGLRLMVFKGKLAAGCQEHEKVTELQRRGISSGNLCYRKDTVVGEDEHGHPEKTVRESWCRYHPENPARDPGDRPCENILQRLQVAHSDLVLAPHAFIHVNVPKVLKACKAVVIDERIWDKTIGTATIPLDTFTRVRGAPPPTKKQWMENPNVDMSYMLASRDDATKCLMAALRENRNPAEALLDMRVDFGNGHGKTGMELVDDALAVTGRGQREVLEIEPGMDISTIREITSRAQGKHILEEHRAWTILKEAMETLQSDRIAGRNTNRDTRLQYLTDTAFNLPTEELGISWRRKRNFETHPTLFLDASGSKKILEKLWGREIEMEVVEASEHRRVLLVPDASYSKTGLIPNSDDRADTLRGKAYRMTLLRDALYTTSAMYGFGGVIAGAALGVRRVLDDLGWGAPENLHFVHYGALRGLDFAKDHSAAISIGSIAPSWRDIDRYVGALTYDDASPEAPIDYLGSGLDGEGKDLVQPTVEARYPTRDGGYVVIEGVADFETPWAGEVYHQIREEEINQFGGRLRAVYREGRAPVWIVLGKVLPAGCIVDEVISLADLARPLGRSTRSLEAVRQSGGLVARGATWTPSVDVCSVVAVDKLVESFGSNPRLAEGFHEVSYRLSDEREERRAWVNAATGSDPVETVAARVGDLHEPARLVREARVVPFGKPAVDPDRIVYGIREQAIIAAREAALEQETEEGAEPVFVPAIPAGDRTERWAAELEAKMLAAVRIDHGTLHFDDKRLGVKMGSVTVDIDTFLMAEQIVEARKAIAAKLPEAKPEAVPEPAPAPVPVAISWSSDPFETWEAEPANSQEPVADNVIALPPPRPRPAMGFGTMRRSLSG